MRVQSQHPRRRHRSGSPRLGTTFLTGSRGHPAFYVISPGTKTGFILRSTACVCVVSSLAVCPPASLRHLLYGLQDGSSGRCPSKV